VTVAQGHVAVIVHLAHRRPAADQFLAHGGRVVGMEDDLVRILRASPLTSCTTVRLRVRTVGLVKRQAAAARFQLESLTGRMGTRNGFEVEQISVEGGALFDVADEDDHAGDRSKHGVGPPIRYTRFGRDKG